MNILLIVEHLKEDNNDKLILNLKICGRCRGDQIMELFRIPMAEEMSFKDLLIKIHNDKRKDLKVKFEDFMVMCPVCKDKDDGITSERMNKDDLELLNNTPLSKIWIAKAV